MVLVCVHFGKYDHRHSSLDEQNGQNGGHYSVKQDSLKFPPIRDIERGNNNTPIRDIESNKYHSNELV